MERTYIQQMADFVFGVKYENLPADVIDKAKISIIDSLECSINSMTDARGEAAFLSIRKDCCGHKSTLFNKKAKADAADAAYYNSVKQSITSRNDTSMKALCHPGPVIVPTVMSLAEEFDLTGKQMIEAVVAGYEAMSRFGLFLIGRMNRAWRTTAVFGPVGAAFAAAKCAGLDADGIASAASFACHLCGGVNEWALSGTGEDVFQNANGTRTGIQAMRLAKNGAKGCPTIIEGQGGLGAAYGIYDGYEMLVEDFNKDWLILNVINKPITSCIVVQNPCQTAFMLLEENPQVKAEDIDSVEVEVCRANYQMFGCANNTKIDNVVDAIMSIAYGVANAFVNRTYKKLNFMPPYDPRVIDLMRRVTPIPNDSFKNGGSSTALITVHCKDGSMYSARREILSPLTRDEVIELFRSSAIDSFGKANADKATNLLLNLEIVRNFSEVSDLLR